MGFPNYQAHASLGHAHRNIVRSRPCRSPPSGDDCSGSICPPEACLARGDHSFHCGWPRNRGDHAADGQVQALRLALAGALHARRRRRALAGQDRFVAEYPIDLNATQAAIRAGYSKKTAKSVGSENLTKPDIAKAVAAALARRADRVEVNQDYVLSSIVDAMERAKLPAEHNPAAVMRGAELLGKHLGMFFKVLHGNDPDNPLPTPNSSVTIFQLPDNGRD